jgi:hypothetical protein
MLDLEVLRLTWGCYAWPGGAVLGLEVLRSIFLTKYNMTFLYYWSNYV